jgi:hypothetical protein
MRRMLLLAAVAAVGAAFTAAPASAATTTVGSPLTAAVTNELCSAPCTVANLAVAGATVKVPATGTITSWSFKANTGGMTGTYALRVVRPSGTGFIGAGTLVASGINTATDQVFTKTANQPVNAGDFIGLDTLAGPGSPDATSPSPADQIAYFAGPDLSDNGGALAGIMLPQHEVLVQATIETASAGNGGGGVDPNTKIKKRPKNKSDDTTPTFKFKATEAGSTFKCKLDHKKFKKCKSPKTFHGLDPGKHKFKVEAIDSDGNVDSTPAKDKFKVLP